MSLMHLFWTSGHVSSEIQNQSVHLICAWHIPCDSLKFPSDATTADLLAVSMAAKSFSSTYLQAGIGGAEN